MAKYKKNQYPDTSCGWATEIYVDIQYVDEYIIKTHLNCIVSPLHDKDVKVFVDNINGHVYKSFRDKKPHRHVFFIFPRPVSENTFSYMLEHKIESHGFTCVGRERIYDIVSYARYLIHLDNLEKAQYRKSDLIFYGQVNDSILNMYSRNVYDKYAEQQILIDDILKHRFTNIIDMERYYKVTNPDMLTVMHANRALVNDYCKSMFYKEIDVSATRSKKAQYHHDNYCA